MEECGGVVVGGGVGGWHRQYDFFWLLKHCNFTYLGMTETTTIQLQP